MGSGTVEVIHDAFTEGQYVIMEHYGSLQNTYDSAYLQRIVILMLNIETISEKQSGEWPQ
jgi:hypothetical protein